MESMMKHRKGLVLFAVIALGVISLYSSGSSKLPQSSSNSKNVVLVNTNEKLAEVVQQNKLVLVDVYADWCPLCQELSPHVNKLADEQLSYIKVVKVNVDEANKLVNALKVDKLPTLLLLKEGEQVSRSNEMMTYGQLLAWIQKYGKLKG